MPTFQSFYRGLLEPRTLFSALFCTGIFYLYACSGEFDSSDSYADRSPVELTEIMRLGNEAQGDTVLFGNIRSMAINSAGQLIVGDSKSSDVYVFSSDGDLEGHFGGKGGGPGEFEWMENAVVGPGDSLFVFDWMHRRISAFDPDTYQFKYSVTLESNGAQSPGDLIDVTEQGFVIRYNRVINPSELSAYDSQDKVMTSVMRVDWHGEPADSILGLRLSTALVAADRSMIIARPFARNSMVRPGPGGILYSGWNDSIHIEKTGVDGQPHGALRMTHDPMPVTWEDLEDVMKGRDEKGRQMIQFANLSTTCPAYRTFVVDDEHRVWVQLYHPKDASIAEAIIIGAEGFVDGEVELPVGVILMAVRSGRAYGKFEDPQTGAPLVVGYEISGL